MDVYTMDAKRWRAAFVAALMGRSDVTHAEAVEMSFVECDAQSYLYGHDPTKYDDPEAIALEVMQDWDEQLQDGTP